MTHSVPVNNSTQQHSVISVAMIMGYMGKGGVEAVVMNYIRQLARKEIRINVILHENSTFPQRDELKELGIICHTIPPYSKPLAYHKTLLDLFRQHQYTIVHSHIGTMSLFPLFAAWRAGIPVRICHNHSTAHWGEGIKTLLKYVLRFPARLFATDYFACGEYSARWMFGNKIFDSGGVTIIPNAIDSDAFSFNPEVRRSVRQNLGLKDNCFVTGHVGRFVFQKNHTFLLDVFSALKRQQPDAILLLIGDGPLRAQVEARAKSLELDGSVLFLGSWDAMAQWYSALDVFILPSFYEGLPLVAVEAQANGLPCLFSTHVTEEALLGENSLRLSLDQSPDIWATKALTYSRCAAILPDTFSSETQAKKLHAIYKKFVK